MKLQSLTTKVDPIESVYKEHVMKLDFKAIRIISDLNIGLTCSEEELPIERIGMTINTQRLNMMTPEEEMLQYCTCRWLQKLSTWN